MSHEHAIEAEVVPPETALTVKAPDLSEIAKRGIALVETAKAMVIEDDDQLQEATEWVRGIKKDRKGLDGLLDDWVEAAHLEHKARLSIKKKHVVPIDDSEEIVKAKMAKYQNDRQAKIDAEKKRLDDERRAKEKAEQEQRDKEEKERREKFEAEQKVLREKQEKEQKEAREAADKLAREGQAEAAKKAKEAADKKAKEDADSAAKREEQRKADEIKAKAEADAKAEKIRLEGEKAAKALEKSAKTAGASFSKKHYAKIENKEKLLELVKAVAAGAVDVEALTGNEKWLNAYAQSSQGEVPMPGVTFYTEDSVAIR